MLVPYYRDDLVTLHVGDCREVLRQLPSRAVTVAVVDPPYAATSLEWDRWQPGWVRAVALALPYVTSLWCFGSARMFLDHANEFCEQFTFGQEALWVKRNGSGPTDRTRLVKIHEWAYHWYRGPWSGLHHDWEREPYFGADKSATRAQLAHRGVYTRRPYVDDGTRQPRSVTFVIEAPSVRYTKRHPCEKPESVVSALVRECTPPDGVVLDCFAGSGTTGVVAKALGRRCVLIESDPAMAAVAAQRLDAAPEYLEA